MKVAGVFQLILLLFLAVPIQDKPGLEPITALPDYVTEARDDHLVVAAYNIKWIGQRKKDFDLLADIIAQFDICGIVEVKRESAIRTLVETLNRKEAGLSSTATSTPEGPWRYVFGVKTRRLKGRYYESYAVVWRSDRASLGNGLVSNVWDKDDQFRNDPFLVSFKAGKIDFTLLLVHTRFNDDAEGSLPGELKELGQQVDFLRGYLEEDDIFLMGDFNAFPGPLQDAAGNDIRMNKRQRETSEAIILMADNGDIEQLNPNYKSTISPSGKGFISTYDHVYATPSARKLIAGDGKAHVLDVSAAAKGTTPEQRLKTIYEDVSDHLPIFFVIKK